MNNGVDLHTRKLIQDYIKENLDTIFFKKHIHWEHENEYRIISDIYPSLNIKEAITNIYMPYQSEYTEYKIIEKLLEGSKVDIKEITTYGSSFRKISAFNFKKWSKKM